MSDGHAERAHQPGLILRQRLGDGGPGHRNLSGEHVVQRRRAAAIDHVGHLDAGLDLELLGREMRHAGEAGGAEIDGAGLGLGERDQLLHVGGRERRDCE